MPVVTTDDTFGVNQGQVRTTFSGNLADNDIDPAASKLGYGWGPTGLSAETADGWVTFTNGVMGYIELVQSGYVTFPRYSTAAVIVTNEGGRVVLNSDGSFTYTSPDGFAGQDTFTYAVYDANMQVIGTSTVQLDVMADSLANQAPVAGDDVYVMSIAQGESYVSEVSLLQNDSDDQSALPELRAVASTFLTDQGGIVSISADGHFVYTPPSADYAGTDSFTYTLRDGAGATDTALVAFEVVRTLPPAPPVEENPLPDPPPVDTVTPDPAPVEPAPEEVDPPILVQPEPQPEPVQNNAPVANTVSIHLPHGSSATGNLLAFASDPDGDTLAAVAGNFTNEFGSTLTVHENGDYTVQSAWGNTKPQSFEYAVTDGKGGTATAVIALTVTNDGPVAASDAFSTAYGKTLSGNVLANDSDPNGDAISVVPAGLRVTANGFIGIDASGNFKYTPKFGFFGTDTATYTVRDAHGAESVGTIEIKVLPPPSAKFGNDGDNKISGTAVADVIYGGDGKDLLGGGEGDDQLLGGDGNDSLYGGNGDDLIHGGTGSDRLYGGAGIDTFVLSGSEGGSSSKIMDFRAEDRIAVLAVELALSPEADTISRWIYDANASPTGEARMLYNGANKTLYWDADGDAATANTVLGTISSKVPIVGQTFDLM